MFISIEGGEGSGKTTLSKRLAAYWIAQGQDVVLVGVPGGTEISLKIRKILLDKSSSIDKVTEMLLFFAADIQLASEIIIPAFNEGKTVICDRWIDSAYVYQTMVRDRPIERRNLYKKILNFCSLPIPDMTIFLHVEPALGLPRSLKRMSEEGINESRFEKKGLQFHKKVNHAYRVLHKEPYFMNRQRIDIEINSKTEDEVFEETKRKLKDICRKKSAK